MDLAGSAGDLLDPDLPCCVHGKVLTLKMLKHSGEAWIFQRCHGWTGSSLWVGDGAGDSASSVFCHSVVRKQLYIFPKVQWGKGTFWSVKACSVPGVEGNKDKTV